MEERKSIFEIPQEFKSYRYEASAKKPARVIDEMLDEYQLIFKDGKFYEYTDNFWQEVNIGTIKDQLHYRYKKNDIKATAISKKAGIEYLSVETKVEEQGSNKYIGFTNGIYEIESGTFKTSSEETKMLYVTNILNAEYNENAECPRWNQFVEEIFEDDPDKEKKALLLQEFLGYCLTHDTRIQQSLIMYGNGANGKSICQQVLEDILTDANYSAIPLESIAKETYLAQLPGKTVNIISEVDPKKVKNPTEVIKRLTGGDKLVARLLYQNPITFSNTAKLLFALNKLPYTSDHTNGFYRRLVILGFNKQFIGEKADPNLLNKLTLEKDGIVQWLLVGLKRLFENNQLTIPKSSYEILDDYKQSTDVVKLFVNETCVLNKDDYSPYKKIYEDFISFCKAYRMKPLRRIDFKEQLQKLYPELVFKPKNCEGKTKRCFMGIKYIGEDKVVELSY